MPIIYTMPGIPCHAMSCQVMSHYFMPCNVTSYNVMSHHVMTCHIMSCHIMSHHVMSWHIYMHACIVNCKYTLIDSFINVGELMSE